MCGVDVCVCGLASLGLHLFCFLKRQRCLVRTTWPPAPRVLSGRRSPGMGFRIGPFYVGGVDESQKKAVLDAAPGLPFNHHPSTGQDGQAGYARDTVQAKVGQGRRDYVRARQLLESWEHFNLGWAYTNAPRVEVGSPVIVVARSLGLWSVNPLRICAKASSRRSMSYSHRTLAGHQISGEERFTLELRSDGGVWYGVETVSRPATLVAKLSLPVLRMYQQKFKRDSLQRMCTLVGTM
jgi:uncharacterized protein (UPF0548 family)